MDNTDKISALQHTISSLSDLLTVEADQATNAKAVLAQILKAKGVGELASLIEQAKQDQRLDLTEVERNWLQYKQADRPELKSRLDVLSN